MCHCTCSLARGEKNLSGKVSSGKSFRRAPPSAIYIVTPETWFYGDTSHLTVADRSQLDAHLVKIIQPAPTPAARQSHRSKSDNKSKCLRALAVKPASLATSTGHVSENGENGSSRWDGENRKFRM